MRIFEITRSTGSGSWPRVTSGELSKRCSMDRLSHAPLGRLLTTTAGFHDRSDPHPYDDCENSNETKKQTQPNPGKREVPMKLVPGGGASAFSTGEGDNTRSRAASWSVDRSGPKHPRTRAAPTCQSTLRTRWSQAIELAAASNVTARLTVVRRRRKNLKSKAGVL